MSNWVSSCVAVWGFTALACGTSGDGKSTGSGATNASDGSAPSNGIDLCGAQFDANETKCPLGADARDANVADCRQQQRNYDGIGCRQQFDAWLVCTTKPAYDCTQDTGCEATQNAYGMCQSQFVQRTGCVRLGPLDVMRCTDAAKPYAFSCLAAAPTACVQVVTVGAGVWCCPRI